jgi:hypothetical protein
MEANGKKNQSDFLYPVISLHGSKKHLKQQSTNHQHSIYIEKSNSIKETFLAQS